jgi:hypothetical protein
MAMPAKKQPKPDEKPQSERFIETAREIEADESGEGFERAFEEVTGGKTKQKAGEKK